MEDFENEKSNFLKKVVGIVVGIAGLWLYLIPHTFTIIIGLIMVFMGSVYFFEQYDKYDPLNLFIALWLSILPAYFYDLKHEYVKRGNKVYEVNYIKSPISKWIKTSEKVLKIKEEQ